MKNSARFSFLALLAQIAFAHAQSPALDAKSIVGTWVGEWSSNRGSARLEFQIDRFDGERISGRVNSQAYACNVGWTALSGKIVGEEVHGAYTIGSPCRTVQITFPLPQGNVISGKWTSEAPGNGTFRLEKRSRSEP